MLTNISITIKCTIFNVIIFPLIITLLHVSLCKHPHHQGVYLYTKVTTSVEVKSTVTYRRHNYYYYITIFSSSLTLLHEEITFYIIWLVPTIFRKVRTETILKIYNLVLHTFLYGSENWTLTALQRRRIEVAETKLLRPLAGYTLY